MWSYDSSLPARRWHAERSSWRLADPSGLFAPGLDVNVKRAIDIKEDDKIDRRAWMRLIR